MTSLLLMLELPLMMQVSQLHQRLQQVSSCQDLTHLSSRRTFRPWVMNPHKRKIRGFKVMKQHHGGGRALERWRHDYNHDRPHDALGMRPPATVYRSDPAPLPRLRLPKYPAGWLVRRVRPHGSITIPGWTGTLGRAFAGLPVGLKPVSPHVYHLYFDSLLLGKLDLAGTRRLVLQPAA